MKSRQAEFYRRRVAQGLCAQCGKAPLITKNHCQECRKKHNARANARYPGGKWVAGGRGRPPLKVKNDEK